jgi:hypothetical protein
MGPYTHLNFGSNAAVTYTGTGTPFICSDTPTTYVGDGGISGLQLFVTNNTGNGLQNNECTWWKLDDVYLGGNGGSATGIPLLFSNTLKWTEQSNLNLVHIVNWNKPVTFQDNCPGNTGCPSFAYSRWREVIVSPVGVGGIGYQMQNDTSFNGSDLDLQCFGGLTAITCLNLTGTSTINLARLKIGGETSGPASVGISTAVGTIFAPITLWERWNAGFWTDSFLGTQIGYIYNVPGAAFLQATPNGLAIGASGSSFTGAFNTNGLTGYRNYASPDANGTLILDIATQTLSNKTLTSPVINTFANWTETTAPSGSTSAEICYGDSTIHALKCSYNNGTFFQIPQVIASGTAVMTTTGITGPNCGSTVTAAAVGVATTDTITFADNAAPAVATNGPLVIKAWPTSGNVNFMYCVQSGTITPAAATLNWRVIR